MSDVDLLRAALPAYEFDEVLGRGAWGIVVAAYHRRLERPVAVKMLPLALTRDDNVRRRFAAEARVLAALDHPHVVRIHDYIEQDEVCALVMERLTGGSLAERLRLGRLRPEQATAIQLATLHGLEHAHQHGVLHRDIKPENLMFAADGVLKITDFGIATVLGDQAEKLTATGVAMGTPAYMAPEQVDDTAAVAEAADIWAAGAVYYEMLTGAVPYPSRGTLQASLLARTRDDPQPITSVAPDLPRALGRTVMRALNRDPAKRYATSSEFADAIERTGAQLWGDGWVESTSTPVYKTSARSSGGAPTTGAVLPAASRRSSGAFRRSRRRTNLWVAASAAVVVAAGTTVGVLAFGGDDANKSGGGVGVQWGSWVAADKFINVSPMDLSHMGPLPKYWGSRLAVGINLDDKRQHFIGPHIGPGIAAETGFFGDPVEGPSWDFHKKSAHPAADKIRSLEASGSAPYVTYYVLRVAGGRVNNDASEADILKQLTSMRVMTAYWKDVTELLKELGSLDQPIPLTVEPGVTSTIEAQVGDATKAAALVASSGNAELRGLPNTFAGWTQAWVRLRDKYAPKVMLGDSLEAWASGDFLVPFGKNYKDSDIPKWAQGFADFYKTLGAKYDFINYQVAYGEAGWENSTNKGANFYPGPADFARLLAWVQGISDDAHTRVVLESVPVGNTIMAPENNTKYHWQDRYAQKLLGDSGYQYLTQLRDAGAIGVVFGFGLSIPDTTCPCDAANDAESQGVPAGQEPTGLRAPSSDDDGGYLQSQVQGYFARGGLAII